MSRQRPVAKVTAAAPEVHRRCRHTAARFPAGSEPTGRARESSGIQEWYSASAEAAIAPAAWARLDSMAELITAVSPAHEPARPAAGPLQRLPVSVGFNHHRAQTRLGSKRKVPLRAGSSGDSDARLLNKRARIIAVFGVLLKEGIITVRGADSRTPAGCCLQRRQARLASNAASRSGIASSNRLTTMPSPPPR